MRIQRVPVILGLFACLPLVGFAEQDVQARFEKSLKDARSLTNIEIQMLDTLGSESMGSVTMGRYFSRTVQYTYIASGSKYRATCKLVSATQTNVMKLSEAAFNGTSFVTYDADSRTMARQNKIAGSSSSELPASPLIAPFLFLAKNSDTCPSCLLRFSDIGSADFAKGLVLPKGQSSKGLLHISMPGLPLGNKPSSWRIDIEEAGDSFTPKTVTLIAEAGMELTYTLLNYTNLSGYQFPTTVKWIATAYPPTSPPTITSTGITTVTSVRIPDQIADSVFELENEKTSAATILDLDQMGLIKPADGKPSTPH